MKVKSSSSVMNARNIRLESRGLGIDLLFVAMIKHELILRFCIAERIVC